MNPDHPISTSKAAAYCKITRQAIYAAIRKGRIKAWKKGNKWITTPGELDRYRLSKYTREFLTAPDGDLVFDVAKGLLSCPQVAKIFSDTLGRPYPLQKVYHRIYSKKLPAHKIGYTWVIHSHHAAELLHYEIIAMTNRDSA